MSEKLPFTFPYNSEEYDVYYGEIRLSEIVQVTTNKGFVHYYANISKPFSALSEDFDLQLDILIRELNNVTLRPKVRFSDPTNQLMNHNDY